jgi:hypothetical protein
MRMTMGRRTDGMARFLAVLLWTAVFLLILLAADQLLVRVPFTAPAPLAVATFYRDLRSRVLDLVQGGRPASDPAPLPSAKPSPQTKGQGPPPSFEALIERQQAGPAAAGQPPAPAKPAVKRPAATEPAPRYVYADDRGGLHFADTLAEIPEQYRTGARLLGE